MNAPAVKIPPINSRREGSSLTDTITRYLKIKRALGCRFNTEERSLRTVRSISRRAGHRTHRSDHERACGPLPRVTTAP